MPIKQVYAWLRISFSKPSPLSSLHCVPLSLCILLCLSLSPFSTLLPCFLSLSNLQFPTVSVSFSFPLKANTALLIKKAAPLSITPCLLHQIPSLQTQHILLAWREGKKERRSGERGTEKGGEEGEREGENQKQREGAGGQRRWEEDSFRQT